MCSVATDFAVLVGAAVLSLSLAAPARAEFFGCKDRSGQVLYTYNGTPGQFHDRYSQNYAVRPRYSHSRTTYYESRRYRGDRSRY